MVELTEPSTIKYTSGTSFKDLDPAKTKAHIANTYKYAVEYVAYLCKGFGWDPMKDGVILSHHEGYVRGYATNHGDVEHIWSKYGYTMAKFRKDVKAKMGKTTTSTATKSKGTKYKVISSDGLNIRAGAGTNTKKIGALAKGATVTVTKVSDNKNWGYVKSKKGWICISSKYVKKV